MHKTRRSRDSLLLIGSGILIGAGVVVLIYFLFIDKSLIGNKSADTASLAPQAGLVAPPFELQSLEGDAISLSHYRGKPVIVNFWATWCGPCRLEMPVFQEYKDVHGSELEILTINSGESEGDVEQFMMELDLDLTVLLDKNLEVNALYQVQGLPSTYFLDEEGIIRFKHLGIISEEQVQGYLSQMGVELD